jgi:transposase
VAQAIGKTKGGRNTKLHAVVDDQCRPYVLMLSAGNEADNVIAEQNIATVLPTIKRLLADRAYDTDNFRSILRKKGIKAVIPPKKNRKIQYRYGKKIYKGRNVVERCFCRLKDFRRIATRYDKLAQNFFSAVCFVATIAYWII